MFCASTSTVTVRLASASGTRATAHPTPATRAEAARRHAHVNDGHIPRGPLSARTSARPLRIEVCYTHPSGPGAGASWATAPAALCAVAAPPPPPISDGATPCRRHWHFYTQYGTWNRGARHLSLGPRCRCSPWRSHRGAGAGRSVPVQAPRSEQEPAPSVQGEARCK